MRPPIRGRALTEDERRVVAAGLRAADARVRRRRQRVAASARGERAPAIARQLGCSDQPGRQVLHACNAQGRRALERRSSRPHTVRVACDAVGCERRRQVLPRSPRGFGHPTRVWPLSLVAAVCAEQGITRDRVSHEPSRQPLHRRDLRWPRVKPWRRRPDPASPQNRRGGIAWCGWGWKGLPPCPALTPSSPISCTTSARDRRHRIGPRTSAVSDRPASATGASSTGCEGSLWLRRLTPNLPPKRCW